MEGIEEKGCHNCMYHNRNGNKCDNTPCISGNKWNACETQIIDPPKPVSYAMIMGAYIEDDWRQLPNFPEPPDEEEIYQDKNSKQEWERYKEALERFSYTQRLLRLKSDDIFKLEFREDLKQYITNLLYSAYDYRKQKLSTVVFDTWVKDEINNINEYFLQNNKP